MSEVIIEVMKKDDLKEVSIAFMKVFNSVGEHWTLEIAKKHIESNFFGDFHFVAKKDNQIIGFIMGFPLIFEQGESLFVDAIAVLEDFQKEGVGSLLWKKMESHARKNNYSTVRLLSNPKLNSFNWYKEMGYEKSGWVEVFKKIN